jgi:WD40 repeat protein
MSSRATGTVLSVVFSPDGRTVATTADDGSVALWAVATGAERESFLGHASGAASGAFSPDGQTLYSAGQDGTVIVWDVAGERRLVRSFRFAKAPLPDGTASVGAVSPDGTLLATTPGPGRIILTRAATLEPVTTLHVPLGSIFDIEFAADGRTIAASGNGGAVLWDTRRRKTTRTFRVGGASAFALSPDGRTLAVAPGNANTKLAVYDVRTGKREALLPTTGSIQAVGFSPDGKLLDAGDLGGRVTVWNAGTLTERFQVGLPARLRTLVFTTAFSPDGKLIASGDANGRVAFWDTRDGHEVGSPLNGLNGGVSSVAFEPSGSTLAVSGNGSLQLFDVQSRRPLGTPVEGAGGSTSFLPDGKHLFAVSGDGTGLLWKVDPVAWEARACQIAHRNLSRAEWHDFLPNRPYHKVCA